MLCDLFGAQEGVLEHNVSVEVVKRHKRSTHANLATMLELGDGAQTFCMMCLISAGALAAYVPPPPCVLAAYADEPELGVLHLDLRDALRTSFTAALVGVLPR